MRYLSEFLSYDYCKVNLVVCIEYNSSCHESKGNGVKL